MILLFHQPGYVRMIRSKKRTTRLDVEVRVVTPMACLELSQDHFQKYMSRNDRVEAVKVSGGKGCRVNHKNFMHGIVTHNAVKYMAMERMPECNI